MGVIVKRTIKDLREYTRFDETFAMEGAAGAMILIDNVVAAGAIEGVVKIGDATNEGVPHGDWEIVIRQVKAPEHKS